ncbi:hypothetical protein CDN99_25580 [Roseateles aquatilis]|uniref:Uncharacterized protein n=1 Tax=Roseateles aquatilis TaxID=431061 RepID=A0A246IUE2_9BURK|nr:hypothetical protein [Roseateles aquatilis]OWQ83840.1 hypothetical protein CDN99_25580 [Roseateles aquatilis]
MPATPDPFGAFFGSMGAGIGNGLGAAIGGQPSGPTLSGGNVDARSFMDGSGWTVATGGAKATGGQSGGGSQGGATGGLSVPGNPASSTLGPLFGDAGGFSQAGMSPLMLLALGGLVLWAALR